MKILVTGGKGFVGQHLVKLLKKREHKVYIGDRNLVPNGDLHENESHVDVLNKESIVHCLKMTRPNVVIHLAAQSNVKISWDNPGVTIDVNVIGTINLVEAVREFNSETKIITVGSSEEYGLTAVRHKFLIESLPCLPQNPYAVSKYCAGEIALQIAKKHNINVIHVRPFNHFGQGQSLGFVVSDFCSQIVEIERGSKEPVLQVGNLEASRDFTDIFDIVDAYSLLIEKGVENGVYNVCSGKGRKISTILNYLLNSTNKEIEVVVDKNKFRPIEVEKFVGVAKKLQDATGWQPSRDFNQSLENTLDWWREVKRA
jgi:GDP-4-dehydro-6-deoxy-D-mannose reductase